MQVLAWVEGFHWQSDGEHSGLDCVDTHADILELIENNSLDKLVALHFQFLVLVKDSEQDLLLGID